MNAFVYQIACWIVAGTLLFGATRMRGHGSAMSFHAKMARASGDLDTAPLRRTG